MTESKECEVSIILCSCDRAEDLKKTLQSLRHVEVPEGWTTELLLMDNASTDATPEVMRAFDHPEMPVRNVREKKQGLSYARNRGIKEAQGRVLLFTDDDVRFPTGWIQGMAQPVLRGTADAVAGGVELAEEVQEDWMTARHRELLASTERIDPDEPSRMVGANMAIADEVFGEIPGFDPELGAGQLGSGEETLFSHQVREAGFRIESAFDVIVEHHPDPSRLSREAWKGAAKETGHAGAYRSYHWEHRKYSRSALYAGCLYYAIRLYLKHVFNGGLGDLSGKMKEDEFLLRRRIHRARKHLRQHGEPRKYDRRGLSKKEV